MIGAQLGDAEVEHLGVAAVGNHQVLGLEIAMDDAGGMGRTKRVRHLHEKLERTLEVETAGLDRLAQRLPRHELHRDVEHRRSERDAVPFRRALTDVVDRDDVRMVQRGCGSGFLDKTLEPVRIPGHVLTQDLQRQVAAEHRIARHVDFAHPATSDQAQNVEPPDRRVGKVGVGQQCHQNWRYFSPCRVRTSSSHERTSTAIARHRSRASTHIGRKIARAAGVARDLTTVSRES